jgi:hypothetical protein
VTCAYKDASGAAVYYTDYQRITFEGSPACSDAPTPSNSRQDSTGRLWGGGHRCLLLLACLPAWTATVPATPGTCGRRAQTERS